MLAYLLEARFREAGETVETRALAPPDFERGSPAMEWRTPSFFARRRIFVLPDLAELKRDQGKEIGRYLEAPEPSAVLVVPVADRRMFQPLSAASPSWRAAWLREEEVAAVLASYVAESAGKAGKAIHADAADFLARWVGPDFALLRTEVAKLLSYAGDDREIGEEAIRRVCVAGGGVDPFLLAGALFDRNPRECLSMLRRFAASADDRDYHALVGAIAWVARKRLSGGGGRNRVAVTEKTRARGAAVLGGLSAIDRGMKGESRLSPGQVFEIRLLKLLAEGTGGRP